MANRSEFGGNLVTEFGEEFGDSLLITSRLLSPFYGSHGPAKRGFSFVEPVWITQGPSDGFSGAQGLAFFHILAGFQ